MTPKLPSSLVILTAFACFAGWSIGADYDISPDQKGHWAWKKPVRAPLPTVRNDTWARNPIDTFILARVEAAGLAPAPPASREQLIRRASFDLVGLPPTPDEVDSFVNDTAANAWEKVVDRLLASPHYGERWGRHWLDLARFAESNGFEFDEVRPNAWRYRDYVIRSFNDDKPYDQFVMEQLAGDEWKPKDTDALIATGFNLLGPDMTDASDQAQRRQNTLNDITDTAGLVFLGLTISCARCHDHKFEPIPQADYYRLQAFFAPAALRPELPIATPAQREDFKARSKEYAILVKPIQEKIDRIEALYRQRLVEARLAVLSEDVRAAHQTPADKRTDAQKVLVAETMRQVNVAPADIVQTMTEADRASHQSLRNEMKKHDGKKPAPLPATMGMAEDGKNPPKTVMLEGGEMSRPGEEVQPGYPVILSRDNQTIPAKCQSPLPNTTGRRTALASWIASADNPLTARVLVNRIWQHHFGRGLVTTPSDFGVKGAAPTHPELLDWLATEFVANGWSMKRMHRTMMLSATYLQASKPSPEALAKDPDNQLFTRMHRLRLEGEIIRDGLLACSGRLDRKMGGPSVIPPAPAEPPQKVKGRMPSSDPRDLCRRSVYIFARRNLRFPFLEAFDLPDSNLSCPKRQCSTTAPQALALLNSADVIEASKALAKRATDETTSEEERITRIYRLALGRLPSDKERRIAGEFLRESPLSELCRALFNTNEFVYVD